DVGHRVKAVLLPPDPDGTDMTLGRIFPPDQVETLTVTFVALGKGDKVLSQQELAGLADEGVIPASLTLRLETGLEVLDDVAVAWLAAAAGSQVAGRVRPGAPALAWDTVLFLVVLDRIAPLLEKVGARVRAIRQRIDLGRVQTGRLKTLQQLAQTVAEAA